MKIAINILAAYMIGLSLVPCSDGGSSVVDVVMHILNVEHEHHSSIAHWHCNDSHEDSCPPFCICTCCSFAIDRLDIEPFQLEEPIAIMRVQPFFVSNLYPISIPSGIWQPPKT